MRPASRCLTQRSSRAPSRPPTRRLTSWIAASTSCTTGRAWTPAGAAIVVVGRYFEARDLATQLEQALQSRAVIDHAIGIIMAESRCDADQAFAMLSRASNNRNIKLRDLATEIVMQVGGRPPSHPAE